MKSTIEILFNDLVGSAALKKDAEYAEHLKSFSTLLEELDGKLPEEQKQVLSDIHKESCECEYESNKFFFAEGFKYGLISIFEGLSDK